MFLFYVCDEKITSRCNTYCIPTPTTHYTTYVRFDVSISAIIYCDNVAVRHELLRLVRHCLIISVIIIINFHTLTKFVLPAATRDTLFPRARNKCINFRVVYYLVNNIVIINILKLQSLL